MILVLHVFACWFMTGVIWTVQILVYPQFKQVGKTEFSQTHKFHTERITWIVAPMMTLELLTAIWLCFQNSETIYYGNLASVILVWILTAVVNVPTHNKLKHESEASKLNLVRYNWPRTLIWTLRSIFLFQLSL